jgi:hypothetical protein
MQALDDDNAVMASFYADEQKVIEEEMKMNKDELEGLSRKNSEGI